MRTRTAARRASLLLTAATGFAVVSACSSPEGNKVKPITGTLFNASGSTAPLTIQQQVLGSGFSMSAVLDDAPVEGSGVWHCYAPDVANEFPNFDIEATDETTWGFFLSINPAVWGSGTIAIDGVNVVLQIATDDRYGTASGGNLTLIRAGEAADVPGEDCQFAVSPNIHLVGERDD